MTFGLEITLPNPLDDKFWMIIFSITQYIVFMKMGGMNESQNAIILATIYSTLLQIQ